MEVSGELHAPVALTLTIEPETVMRKLTAFLYSVLAGYYKQNGRNDKP
jgi:hypothetical protein